MQFSFVFFGIPCKVSSFARMVLHHFARWYLMKITLDFPLDGRLALGTSPQFQLG